MPEKGRGTAEGCTGGGDREGGCRITECEGAGALEGDARGRVGTGPPTGPAGSEGAPGGAVPPVGDVELLLPPTGTSLLVVSARQESSTVTVSSSQESSSLRRFGDCAEGGLAGRTSSEGGPEANRAAAVEGGGGGGGLKTSSLRFGRKLSMRSQVTVHSWV